MNQERFHGLCMQVTGKMKEQWGRLAGDARTVNAGKSDCYAGRVLEQRGISAQEAQRQLSEFMRRNRNWWDLSGR